MNGLLEFMFERVPTHQLAPVVVSMMHDESNVSEGTRDGAELQLKSLFEPAYWNDIACASEDVICNVNCRALRIGDKSIDRATLQVIHYGDVTDVSVLVSSEDCKNGGVVAAKEIFEWAKGVSERYGVVSFYGGLEPARDQHTQLFSNEGVGAISLY